MTDGDKVEDLTGRLAVLAERRGQLLAGVQVAHGRWKTAVEAGLDAREHHDAVERGEREVLVLDREAEHLAGLLAEAQAAVERARLQAQEKQAAKTAQAALRAYQGAADGFRGRFGQAIADFADAVREVYEARADLEAAKPSYVAAMSAHAEVLAALGVPPHEWPAPAPDLIEQLGQRLMAEHADLLHIFHASVDVGFLAAELGGYMARQIDITADATGRRDNLGVLARVAENAKKV